MNLHLPPIGPGRLVDQALFSIDAGKHGFGIACWDLCERKMVKAGYVPIPSDHLRAAVQVLVRWIDKECGLLPNVRLHFSRLVIEQMKVYSPEHSRGDPKDLIAVSHVVGALCTEFNYYDLVEPFEWKGDRPKSVTRNIMKRDMEEDELANIVYPKAKKTLGHNVDDAVFLGLQSLKTLKMRKSKIISPARTTASR